MQCRHLRVRALMLAVLLPGCALAQGGFGNVVIELDDQDGYLAAGAIGGSFSARTSWDASLSRSETSTTLSDLSTTSIDASLYADFGRLGLRVGLGGWSDEDFVEARELSAAVDVHVAGWSLALETQLRASDFEPFAVDRTIILRDGTPYTIAGLADCAVDDTGLGARLRWASSDGGWRVSVNTMSFDYDDFGCNFSLPALDRLARATRAEFVQLADRVADVLSLGAGRRLAAEHSFLDSRVGFSLSRSAGVHTYSIYYDAVEEVFFGRSADTLSAGVSFLLESGREIEVYAGVTDGDMRSSVAFLGLSLLVAR